MSSSGGPAPDPSRARDTPGVTPLGVTKLESLNIPSPGPRPWACPGQVKLQERRYPELPWGKILPQEVYFRKNDAT